MKFKNLKWSVLLMAGALTVVSCSDDFLNTDFKGAVSEGNYYQTEDDAYHALIAVYDIMKKESGGFENMIAMLNAGSDDFYAGGGNASDGIGIQSFSNYSISQATIPGSFWSDYYQGIFRANVLLQKLPGINMDAAKKARFTAETKALRAYYYFQLITQFRNIPLTTTPLSQDQWYSFPQAASRADVYAQIETDLTEAIPDLPPMLDIATEAGRISKGAGQAILGKVYLYQDKKPEAAAQFAEVNGTPGGTSQYGYKLLANYADLWAIDNKFNSESILEAAHTSQSNAGWGNWGSGSDEGNTLNVMVGPRGYSSSGAPAYETGWSFNPATLDLVNAMQGDPRFDATLLDMNALVAAGQASYVPGYQDTGYFLKKFMPTHADITTGGGDVVLNYRQNTYTIRLADTYLLEAEALGGTGARAQALLDAVRARVGLASIPVSLDNIMKERRLELAGEGHRWRDLVRTGRAATVLASRGFIAGKHEFWPIPIRETENTQIVQDPNY
ncbi:RagB/SusD family nutrient uptake outer membrane protein [Flavobacterium album]|uniref:RagB/SusD family nutrient uptake outer membrane protein n=1 Tax=Flavobacterium album TaxID=2175091 RepID=A0A2S1R2U1_9FLAO|nr:RagB/SusD family nutrient uptake outer membrane protein [Flavobacterium album]AWH86932.1 RagB/SusD family nutrient uptake outer membrane protein [Flavobacterium album]